MEFLNLVEEMVASGSATGCALNESLNTVDRALSLYGWSKLAMTFNGGKDSTVMLHVVRAVAFRRARRELAGSGTPEALEAEARRLLGQMVMVYFDNGDDFEEIMDFTREAAAENQMKLLWYRCSYREGLQRLMDETGAMAVLMGTRKSDPHAASLTPFTPTSAGWPPIMRVNPLLHWDYALVWDFLRTCRLPYCVLYDCGYTSLGSKASSAPNPLLRRADGTYRPAHELADGCMEREGRTTAKQAPKPRPGPEPTGTGTETGVGPASGRGTLEAEAALSGVAGSADTDAHPPVPNARVAALTAAAAAAASAASTPGASPLSPAALARRAAAAGARRLPGMAASPRVTVVHVDGTALRGGRAPRGLLPVGRALFAAGVRCARAAMASEEDGAAVAAQVASGVSATDAVLVVCHATPSLPICTAAVAQAIGVPLQRHQPLSLALTRAARATAEVFGFPPLTKGALRADAPQNGVLVWPRPRGEGEQGKVAQAGGAAGDWSEGRCMVALTVGPVAIVADASVPHALLDTLEGDAEPDHDAAADEQRRPWAEVVDAVLGQWAASGVVPAQRPRLALELEAAPVTAAGARGAGAGARVGVVAVAVAAGGVEHAGMGGADALGGAVRGAGGRGPWRAMGEGAGTEAEGAGTEAEGEAEEGKEPASSPSLDLPDGTRTPSVPLAGRLLHGSPVRVQARADALLRAMLRAACGVEGRAADGRAAGGSAPDSVSSSPSACSEDLPLLLPRGGGTHGEVLLEALLRGEPRVGAALGVVRVSARRGVAGVRHGASGACVER